MSYEGRVFTDDNGDEWTILGPWALNAQYYEAQNDKGDMVIRPVGVVNQYFSYVDNVLVPKGKRCE